MKNIVIASAGGKGEILTENIINYAALYANIDVKSYGALGLSQRNGIAYIGVRMGENIQSPFIPVGCGDIMLGLEPIEAYRQSYYMKKCGTIILNNFRIYPSVVIMEEEEYPDNICENLSRSYNVIPYNFFKVNDSIISNGCDCKNNFRIRTGEEFIPRKIIISNSFAIGILAKLIGNIIPKSCWIDSFYKNIPQCVLKENLKAFYTGYEYK